MINVSFNDEIIEISEKLSLMTFLEEVNYQATCCAVAVNRQFVPRVQHESTFLHENYVIEIIIPMQGG